jgi:hypothetical protein
MPYAQAQFNQMTQPQQLPILNAKSYGAQGNNTGDDSAAINAALTAALAAGGGMVILPAGTYRTTGAIVIPGDGVILCGAGMGATTIQPASGANFDAISTPLPGSAGLANFSHQYIGICHLGVNGTNMTGSTAGNGNLIHTYGVRFSFIRDCLLINAKNWAILCDGDNTGPGFNFSYNIQIARNVFDLNNGNVYMQNSEANEVIYNQFKWCGSAAVAAQPLFSSPDTVTMHCRCGSGFSIVQGNVFGSGGTYTTPAIRCENSGPTRIIGNRFDQVRNQAVVLNGGNHEFIGNILTGVSSVAGSPGIQLGSSNNRVIGNSFDITAGSNTWTNCVAESGGPFSDNLIADNALLAGSAAVIVLNATSTARVHHNKGWNPVGNVAAPTFPATTVAATNNTGLDVTAYITNGTSAITQVQIAGVGGSFVNTNLNIVASGWGVVRIPAGAQVKFTYAAGAPAWTWFAD